MWWSPWNISISPAICATLLDLKRRIEYFSILPSKSTCKIWSPICLDYFWAQIFDLLQFCWKLVSIGIIIHISLYHNYESGVKFPTNSGIQLAENFIANKENNRNFQFLFEKKLNTRKISKIWLRIRNQGPKKRLDSNFQWNRSNLKIRASIQFCRCILEVKRKHIQPSAH